MKKPLFNSGVKCQLPATLAALVSLLTAAALEAQNNPYGQIPPPGYVQAPAYSQQAPAYSPQGSAYAQQPSAYAPSPAYAPYPTANNGAYTPGAYQPPTVTSQNPPRPKSSRTQPKSQAAPPAHYNTGAPMSLEAKVGQLAQNDAQQDQRLHYLERDVTSLKAGAADPGYTVEGGRYISNPTSTNGAAPRYHTVRQGETLWGISAKYNTSVNAVRAANRLPGNSVIVGQTLMIPVEGGYEDVGQPAVQSASASSVHVVKKGQTFEEIAKMYKLTPDTLARANPSAYPDRLLIGERLIIPGRKGSTASSNTNTNTNTNTNPAAIPDYYPPATQAPRPTKSKSGAGLASGSGTHKVRAGESLGAIAKSYGISTARLAAANNLKNPNLLEVGRVLVIPGGAGQSPAGAATAAKKSAAPKVASTTPKSTTASDTVPLPGAGMPMPKPPAPVAPPVKPTPPPGLDMTAATPAPVKKTAPAQVGSHRGVLAYRLERGDSVESVANMFSTSPEKIRELNKLSADAKVKEGDELVVPAMGPVSVN